MAPTYVDYLDDILDRLVGSISPKGDSVLDREHQENIPAFEKVCDWVAYNLEEAYRCKDSQFYSMQQTAKKTLAAADYLIQRIKDYEEDANE
jgi:hypothetical protein